MYCTHFAMSSKSASLVQKFILLSKVKSVKSGVKEHYMTISFLLSIYNLIENCFTDACVYPNKFLILR